jgi:hypothetical protein
MPAAIRPAEGGCARACGSAIGAPRRCGAVQGNRAVMPGQVDQCWSSRPMRSVLEGDDAELREAFQSPREACLLATGQRRLLAHRSGLMTVVVRDRGSGGACRAGLGRGHGQAAVAGQPITRWVQAANSSFGMSFSSSVRFTSRQKSWSNCSAVVNSFYDHWHRTTNDEGHAFPPAAALVDGCARCRTAPAALHPPSTAAPARS